MPAKPGRLHAWRSTRHGGAWLLCDLTQPPSSFLLRALLPRQPGDDPHDYETFAMKAEQELHLTKMKLMKATSVARCAPPPHV